MASESFANAVESFLEYKNDNIIDMVVDYFFTSSNGNTNRAIINKIVREYFENIRDINDKKKEFTPYVSMNSTLGELTLSITKTMKNS